MPSVHISHSFYRLLIIPYTLILLSRLHEVCHLAVPGPGGGGGGGSDGGVGGWGGQRAVWC